MQVLSPDVFADLLELPLAALGIIAALGAAIALIGWRWHRFWLTITVSLISGLIGIRQAPVWGIEQPIMAGVLLATAAGCLALSLARVGMFLAYGLTIWYAMKRFAPPYAIPAICICAGGLFSVLFYRFCVALLTAAFGSLLLCYGGLAFAQQKNIFSVSSVIQEQPLIASAIWAGLTFFTLSLQLYFWRRAKQRLKKARLEFTEAELEAERRLGFPTKRIAA
jgi:hypothetical protein